LNIWSLLEAAVAVHDIVVAAALVVCWQDSLA
jgi:hypothetical protein